MLPRSIAALKRTGSPEKYRSSSSRRGPGGRSGASGLSVKKALVIPCLPDSICRTPARER
ncbi:MAG TPA: hypothetical protein PLX54_05850 [Candidatus Fermentibacter daniensis]|nr:MAG: hypothetical protein AO395_06320 [Candidatus Fermentibacter daniensis]MBP7719358.1 hypothetical protein [Candidatus Fermentibacter sp.]OQC69068.1 MAG: hypothetical protein BWX47_01445 [candidate division Hyd24-12 bacterium ADurb.Bin004]KZD17453.1 MAG: hypothetical protein AO394_05370 [Candidatus Fermentibacter daniensis]KZD17835.1 MAG: hypothetical protein AO396_02740 [Candidatus Fermentibacter daniensis]